MISASYRQQRQNGWTCVQKTEIPVMLRHKFVFGMNLPLGVSMQMLCSMVPIILDHWKAIQPEHLDNQVQETTGDGSYRRLEGVLLRKGDFAMIDPLPRSLILWALPVRSATAHLMLAG